MTPAEWIAAGSALFTAGAVIVGGGYVRGKLDALQQAMERRLTALETQGRQDNVSRESVAREEGAQSVRNLSLVQLSLDMRALTTSVTGMGEGLRRHEDRCDERQADAVEHFRRLDERADTLNRQMGAVAANSHDQFLTAAPRLPPKT